MKVKADAPFVMFTQKDGGNPGWLPMCRKNIPVRGTARVKEQPWSNAVGSPTRANPGIFRLAHSNTDCWAEGSAEGWAFSVPRVSIDRGARICIGDVVAVGLDITRYKPIT